MYKWVQVIRALFIQGLSLDFMHFHYNHSVFIYFQQLILIAVLAMATGRVIFALRSLLIDCVNRNY